MKLREYNLVLRKTEYGGKAFLEEKNIVDGFFLCFDKLNKFFNIPDNVKEIWISIYDSEEPNAVKINFSTIDRGFIFVEDKWVNFDETVFNELDRLLKEVGHVVYAKVRY